MGMYVRLLLIGLLMLAANMVSATTHMCTTGSETFNFTANADNDIIVATASCSSVTINCSGSGGSDGYCEPIQVFAAAEDVTINCTARDACRGSSVYIGEMTQTELDIINANLPAGQSALTFQDFEGVVENFNLNCGDSSGNTDRDVCRGMTLRTFDAVKYQTINCELATRSCAEMDAELFNVFYDGAINLQCGSVDRYQCDAGQYQIELVSDIFSCTGVTCAYVGCESVGCSGQTAAPDMVDTDGDGQSSFYDNDSDNDGVSDEAEIALGTDPEDASDVPSDAEVASYYGGANAETDTDLVLSPSSSRFVSDCATPKTQLKTFTLTNQSGETRKVSSVILMNGESGTDYTIESSNCPFFLSDGASCQVSVAYCAASNAATDVLQLYVEDSTSPLKSAALYSEVSDSEEAQRRLPPVMSSVSLTPSAVMNGDVAELNAGVSYTVDFSILGYHAGYDAWAVWFKCSVGDSTCGDDFSNGYFYLSSKLAGSASPSVWSYEGVSAQEFSYNDSICFEEAGEYVLRLYRRSINDALTANGSLSLLMPGNSGLPSYEVDKSGRRLSVSVVTDGVCP
jgi:hypothetical protein